MALVAPGAQSVGMTPIVGIVDKAAEMNRVGADQVGQEMMGPDLVALGGRSRDAMRKEQDFRQAPHPRPRAISGPSALATRSGRRRQSAMKIAYLGLSGLTSGILEVRSNRYSWCSFAGSNPQIRL